MEEEKNQSFLEIPVDSDFSFINIPFGVFSTVENPKDLRCATRIGDQVIDLRLLENQGLFASGPLFNELHKQGTQVFADTHLNTFSGLTRKYWREARETIQSLFTYNSKLREDLGLLKQLLYSPSEVIMHLPMRIGDYTDFYSSKSHAYNIGCILRGKDNALQPNWLYLPVGYHGRSSTVVITGTDIIRPRGQTQKSPTEEIGQFTECKRLDFELEMATYLGGTPNQLGHPIKVDEADEHIFGFSLLNDWSARDLQAWQYVPLGPFTAKNLATSVSPWIITVEALDFARVELEPQIPDPVPYLKQKKHQSFDINLEVYLKTEKSEKADLISKSNYKHMYWSITQQIAHHAISGCIMNPGDLFGSGTISGTEKESWGSLMEISWSGKEPIKLSSGEQRTFLLNGDTVTLKGFAVKDGQRIGFGECTGQVLPPLPESEYY